MSASCTNEILRVKYDSSVAFQWANRVKGVDEMTDKKIKIKIKEQRRHRKKEQKNV